MMSKDRIIVAIDFDGTIVEQEYPEIGKLKSYAKEAVNKLYDNNFYIIIWTCRGGSELVKMREFLIKNNICFSTINENAPFSLVNFIPFPKVYADYYIDDKNLGGFAGWKNVLKVFGLEE